jgi:hypothetical protein
LIVVSHTLSKPNAWITSFITAVFMVYGWSGWSLTFKSFGGVAGATTASFATGGRREPTYPYLLDMFQRGIRLSNNSRKEAARNMRFAAFERAFKINKCY